MGTGNADQESPDQENTDHERGNLEMNRQRTEQNSERQIQIEEQNLEQNNIPQNEGFTNDQANREEDQVYLQKKAELKEKFIKNYNKYKEMNINYREYSTKATPPPEQNNIKILNEILSEEFSEQEHSLDQWTLNVIQYASAVTILEQENHPRGINGRAKRPEKPSWKIRIESQIEAICKKLSHTYTLLQCLKTNKYTKHQLTIKRCMEKQYGRCTTNKLKDIQVDLKQDLKVESIKLKKRKTIEQRCYIN